MRKVFLDTNFLLIPAQFKVDIYSEIDRLMEGAYELWIFKESLDELDKIATGGLRIALEVKMAKALLKKKALNIVPLPSECETVDDGLLSLADSIVATQDMALKRLLRAKHTTIITLRKKQYLEIEK